MNNNDSNPFDEEEQGIQSQDDNAPVFLPDDEEQNATLAGAHSSTAPVIEKRKGRISPLMGVIVFLIFGYLAVMGVRYLFNINNVPAPKTTPIPTPNMIATQKAWVKPLESPSIGSVEEAKQAIEAGDVANIYDYVFDNPDIPDINQPGDVYIFNLEYTDGPVTWAYGWCAKTKEVLEDNFKHMELIFTINEVRIPTNHLYIDHNEREDGSPCWTYVALLNSWPEGIHHLDIQVTFTEPVNDGWNTSPKGTHVFRYFVTVQP